MCTEIVQENQEEKLLFLYGGRLENAFVNLVEDRDRIVGKPRRHRFSNRAAYTICNRANAVVIVPYSPDARRWLGQGIADEAHAALFAALDRPATRISVVRTTGDRVGFWLTTIAEYRSPDTQVFILDRTGAHRVSDWRAAA